MPPTPTERDRLLLFTTASVRWTWTPAPAWSPSTAPPAVRSRRGGLLNRLYFL